MSKQTDTLKVNNSEVNTSAETSVEPTSVIIDHAENPKAIVVFAHGAGADKSHDFMTSISQHLVKQHISVLRFNFPYMDKRLVDGKKRPPDRMPKLLPCFINVVNQLNKYFDHLSATELASMPVFIGGKSMGSRVAATITSETLAGELKEEIKVNRAIAGTFCLGYPFYPIGKPDKTRLAPLTERAKAEPTKAETIKEHSILIVQGSRDKLGDKQAIESYHLPPQCQVVLLEDGDHDLKPRVKSGFTHAEHIQSAANAISEYIDTVVFHIRS